MTTAVLGELKSAYHRAWWALLLRGVLGLAIGVFVLIRPLDSVAAFALVIAWWSFFTGVVEIVQAIELHALMKHWWVMLLSGLVGVGFGVASLIYYPILALTYAVILVAWWLMITGILGLYASIGQKQLGLAWGWTAAFSVVSILASGFALLAPPATLAAIMSLIAAFGIVSGVALIVGAFRIRSLVHA
jgi:uncharacterized membrane protein HdeD (DUF308 family)